MVTQQAGNRAGISVCLLPKPLVPPHTHTVLKTPMQFLLLLTEHLPLAVDTMDVDFLLLFLVRSEPRTGNSFGIQNSHRQGARLFD